MIDYQEYNLNKFKEFINSILTKQLKGSFTFGESRDKVYSIMENDTAKLSGQAFYSVIILLNQNLETSCQHFFKNHPAKLLNSVSSNSTSRLRDLLAPHLNSRLELSKASQIGNTRLGELFNETKGVIYACEVYGLAIAFGIKPHILFEYFYGDGERPVIGVLPKPVEGNKSAK